MLTFLLAMWESTFSVVSDLFNEPSVFNFELRISCIYGVYFLFESKSKSNLLIECFVCKFKIILKNKLLKLEAANLFCFIG